MLEHLSGQTTTNYAAIIAAGKRESKVNFKEAKAEIKKLARGESWFFQANFLQHPTDDAERVEFTATIFDGLSIIDQVYGDTSQKVVDQMTVAIDKYHAQRKPEEEIDSVLAEMKEAETCAVVVAEEPF